MVDLSVSLISSAPSHAVSTEYAVSVDMELRLHLAWGLETARGTMVSAGGAVGLCADQQARPTGQQVFTGCCTTPTLEQGECGYRFTPSRSDGNTSCGQPNPNLEASKAVLENTVSV